MALDEVPDELSPISGPGGEILLDMKGLILTFDVTKMTPSAVRQFNELTASSGNPIVAEGDAQPVLVYHEHLPELFAVGAIVARAPGDIRFSELCVPSARSDGSCALLNATALRRAESTGAALRVDPSTYRPGKQLSPPAPASD